MNLHERYCISDQNSSPLNPPSSRINFCRFSTGTKSRIKLSLPLCILKNVVGRNKSGTKHGFRDLESVSAFVHTALKIQIKMEHCFKI